MIGEGGREGSICLNDVSWRDLGVGYCDKMYGWW